MFRVASAWLSPTRATAVCGALALWILVLAGTAPAEEAAAGKGQTTIGIRTAEARPSSPRPSPKPWEKSTDEISLDIQPPPGRLPADSFADLIPAARRESLPAQPTRGWGYTSLSWVPSEIVHYPLYFDDQPLERYGQTVCPALQPVVSGAYFFATFPIVPYKIGLDRTHDCVSTAGYLRAGRCAPPVCERLPLELDAALFESGTWVGFLFLFP